eukprot:GHVS01108674.1.p1 GENE.GHVS01108674.1~~GHVS01108674.1.p1  ORF type:complete len:123 (+),score=11.36 GHVS01108674.1:15-383(+)
MYTKTLCLVSAMNTHQDSEAANQLDDVVKLISSEGTEFAIEKSIAFECDVIKNMCQGKKFVESRNQEVRFSNINANLLEKVIEYLKYKHKHEHAQGGTTLPVFHIPADMALDLLLTANYLGI